MSLWVIVFVLLYEYASLRMSRLRAAAIRARRRVSFVSLR
jgi:uncharacterized membrane protein